MPPRGKKPGKSIDAILSSYKKETLVIGPVERSLVAKPRSYRDQDNIHPTDLIKDDYCVRAAFFNLKAEYETQRVDSARSESIFSEGHLIHDKWQGWLRDEGNLEGLWKCLLCESKHWYLSSDLPEDCPTCEIHWRDIRGEWSLVEYAEVPMDFEPLKLSGHADGLINRVGKDKFLLEIKSIGTGSIRFGSPDLIRGSLEESFKGIHNPFLSHVKQGQLYLRIAALKGETDPRYAGIDKIVFLYECKANQEPKEFTVFYDPEMSDEYIELASTVTFALHEDVPPACNQGDKCKRCAKVDAK